jgi:Response regulator containing a CheY-like receiver domain and an HTH DNA-binding domain
MTAFMRGIRTPVWTTSIPSACTKHPTTPGSATLRRRPSLAEAEGIFRRLGAPPWAARVQNELRAAEAQGNTPEPDALAALTPQQQQIVRLAARGPTNREIAERLYLSPRTVSSHLYRAFPKPGITVRSRLRDVLEAHTADRGSG